MEHVRCAQCRNPIRGRQASVRLERAHMTFHADCWTGLLDQVQRDYETQVRDDGVSALLAPYERAGLAAWLPQAAIDAAAEALTDSLAQSLNGPPAGPPAEPLDPPGSPAAGPLPDAAPM